MVVRQPSNIVGRIIVLAGALGSFSKVEKAVETNARTPKG